jgi:hypothetical protein
MEFTCQEDTSLPKMTLCASSKTALELRGHFAFTRFVLTFDDSLPHDLLLVSTDLHDELQQFLTNQERLGHQSRE